MTRARVTRLIVMPVVILLVAWGLSVSSGPRDPRCAELLTNAVNAWCEAAARGERPPVPVAGPLDPGRVADVLRSACRRDDQPAAWSVEVRDGPGPAPAGGATHHAVIRSDGRDGARGVALPLSCENGFPLVHGFSWLED